MNQMERDALKKLSLFASGPDRSMQAASELEDALYLGFREVEFVEDLLDGLAQYRPGGGDYLYGEAEMAKWCGVVLEKLKDRAGPDEP